MKQCDVETAFLYGELEEPLYLKKPAGYDLPPNTVLKLNKAIYGLVQAAVTWYKTLSKFFVDKLKFIKSMADPCLFFKSDSDGICFIPLYVDDFKLIGTPKLENHYYNLIKKEYNIKDVSNTTF